ncbi:MAG: hypothetical protein ACYTBY_11345 [Planctomycetota bacterium]|jgi:sensor domain CHASE-containing protein
MIKKNVTIRAKVLIPMGIVMASLISALVLTEYKVEFSSLEEQYRNYFSSTEKLFDSEVDKQASIIAGLAEMLTTRSELQGPFRDRDRDGLLAVAKPELENLSG